MKIAIDARIIYTSTGRYVDRLLDHLQAIDSDNEYVVLLRREDYDKWNPRSKNFTKQIANYSPYTFGEQIGFAWKLYRLKADLVHFTMPQQPLAYLKKSIVTIHDLTLVKFINKRNEGLLGKIYRHHIKPEVFKFTLWAGSKKATHVITPTDFVRNEVIDELSLSAEKVTRTYEAADPLAAEPLKIDSLAGQKFILYVGNAYPYKNLQRLIDAVHNLNRPDLKLVIAGKPDFFHEELERYVQQRGIKGIVFTGFVNDAELVWLYQSAQAYCFPSLSEGFGLPGLEAMQYGLPVAASNASCLPEVYGDAAVYFDPKDTNDIAKALVNVLDDEKLRERLKKAGPERAKQFSWKKMAEQTLEIYKKSAK
jgi:glycosyltransferase involved in cell wall biosynthesis